MADAPIDGNFTHGLVALSNDGTRTGIPLKADATTSRLLVDSNASGGTTTVVGGTIVVSSGTINAIVSGTVAVSGVDNVTVTNGTIVVSSGTVNAIVSGTVAVTGVDNVTVTDGTIRVSSGTVVVSSGTIGISSGTVYAKIEDTAGNPLTSTASALDVNLKSTTSNVPVIGTVVLTSGTVNLNTGTIYVKVEDTAGNSVTSTNNALDVNLKNATAGTVKVVGGTITAIVGGGTISVQTGTVVVSSGTIMAVGSVASDGVDSGNPVKIGGQARTTNPTAVADADRVNAIFDKLGKQVVVGAIRDLKAKQYTSIYNSTATTTIVTAGGAGIFNDVYGIVLTNRASSANIVTIQDAPSGAADIIFEIPATDTRGFMLPVDSAVPQSGAATSWVAVCSTAGSIEVAAFYVSNT